MRVSALTQSPTFAIVATVAVLGALAIPPGFDTNSNRYLDQALSLLEGGHFHIDAYHFNTVDKCLVDGHYYPAAPPGLSVVIVPVVWISDVFYSLLPESARSKLSEKLADQSSSVRDDTLREFDWGRFLFLLVMVRALVALPIAALLILGVWRYLQLFENGIPRPQLALLSLLLIFGTHALYYVPRLYSHVPAACACVWALVHLAASPAGTHSPRRAALAGFVCGLMPIIDYPMAVVSVIVGLFAVERLRRPQLIAAFAAGVAPCALAFGAYHWAIFGGPLTLAHTFIVNENHQGGVYGVGLPALTDYGRILFSPERGFFLYALIVGVTMLTGLGRLMKPERRTLVATALLIWLALVTVNAGFSADWKAGLSWGPRYLIPALPALAFGALGWWQQGARPRMLLWILAGAGVLLHFMAAAAPFRSVDLDARFPVTSLWSGIFESGVSVPVLHTLDRLGALNLYGVAGQLGVVLLLGTVGTGLAMVWRRALRERDVGSDR